VVVGVRYTNANQGLQYISRPEMGNAPNYVDTELFAAESSTLINYEFGWRNGPYWLLAEISDNHVDAQLLGNPRFFGYSLSGTWALTGEMRPYKRTNGAFKGSPVAQSVNDGGWGFWELGARFSSLDLSDGSIEGGKIDIATVGVSWWLTGNFFVSLGYKRIWNDRRSIESQTDGFTTRVGLILQ